MRILIGLVAAMLLAGCSTPGDLKASDPTISTTTTKAPKQYALCVFPRWQDARSGGSMSETESGYRLLIANDMNTDELLEINKSKSGSRVALYERLAWAPGYGRSEIKMAVKDCL